MNHKLVAYPLLLFAVSLLIPACHNRPKEVLNRKKMERLMYDVYIAEATIQNDYHFFNSPEKKEAYINEVFREHNVTQNRWDTSLSWYSDRIDLYLKMNDSVKARLKRAQDEVDALLILENQQPSFYDPWTSDSYIPPSYSFTMHGLLNGFRFRLDSAEIATKITEDEFVFSFNVMGVPPAYREPPTALMTLVYGDTTIYCSKRLTENRRYRFDATKYIESDTLTGINGFVHLQNRVGVYPRIQLQDIYLGNKRPELDSLTVDSLAVDSLTVDSLTVDSLAVDSLTVDSLAIDSIPTDTVPVRSSNSDVIMLDTISLDDGAVPKEQ